MRKIKLAFGLLGVCLASLSLGAAGAAAASHPYLFAIYKFVPEPNTMAYFEGPCGLAVDATGDIYVSDYYHDDVDVFSSGGGYKTKIAEVEPLDGPCGLAVDPAGELFVNVFHRNVTRFTPAEFPLASKTAFGEGTVIDTGHSTGVAVDPIAGNVYVNDRTQVAVYEPSGAPVEEAGEPVTIGAGFLVDAYGVAVSGNAATEGYVYVADAATDTVKVFDPATDPENPIQTIDGAGTPQGPFLTLRDADLAVDDETGHLFVVHNVQGEFYEHPRAAVSEFNAAGEYRGTVQSPTELWFGEPSGIAVDNSATATAGRVYVTTGNSQMETAGGAIEAKQESSVYAFGPSEPGQRLEATLAGTGEGTVDSTPAGIACPPACAAEYDEGTAVTLVAMPAAGAVFGGWSGCDSEPGGNCLVGMSAAKAVQAEFEIASPAALGDEGSATVAPAPLAIAAAGTPTVVPDPVAQEDTLSTAQRRRRARAKPQMKRFRVRHGHRHRGSRR